MSPLRDIALCHGPRRRCRKANGLNMLPPRPPASRDALPRALTRLSMLLVMFLRVCFVGVRTLLRPLCRKPRTPVQWCVTLTVSFFLLLLLRIAWHFYALFFFPWKEFEFTIAPHWDSKDYTLSEWPAPQGAKNKKDFDWTAQPPTVVRPWMVLNEKKTFLAVNHHNADEDDYLVPPIIHQTYKTANLTKLPYLWQISHIKCQAMFPKYKHILWTDESARQFMKTHYPQHLANYDSYKYPIQRVDAARYFILYHYGGIYIDMDIECFNATLDAVRKQYAAVAPATVPFGVSNDFMMSSKHHPFYKLLMDNLAKWNSYYGSNYPTVMFSTGPAFVDVQLMSYLKMQRARGDEMPENEKVHIMSQDLYGGRMYSFFRHHPGSSWHHEDASFIKSLV